MVMHLVPEYTGEPATIERDPQLTHSKTITSDLKKGQVV